MDGKHFDALSRSVAVPATRRTALGSMVASGLLAAFGIKQAPVAAQEATCVIDFAATVRQGPNAGPPPGEVRGELSFGLSGKGNLENASLRLADGTTIPVVGQATGHSLQMRLQLAANQPLVAIGVGEREITECAGAIDGLITGPAAGDLGDFHALVVRSTGNLGGAGGAGGNAGGGEKKDKKNAGQQGAASGGAASGGAASGGGGGQKKDKKDKQNAGAGGANTGGTQAQGTDTAGASGTTACAAGLTRCGNTCVDLTTDMKNCGACDSVCESGLVAVECRGGVCERATCPAGITHCGAVDGCRDLATDPAHCGACGNACGDAFCVSGVCQATQPQAVTCDQGLTDCGGSCVDLNANRFACGNCTTICAQTDDCVAGVCTPFASTCPNAGEVDCGGTCVNTATSPANCGSCGFACPAGNECNNGACVAPVAPPADNCAPQGLTNCAGFCFDTTSDAANCGACGAACAAGESCVAGACQAPAAPIAQAAVCPVGETDCSGVCTDLMNDFGNCGACGAACGATQGCVGGQCQDQTAPPPVDCSTQGVGLTECAGLCFDLMTDPSNCGACGNVCPGGTCAGGVCA